MPTLTACFALLHRGSCFVLRPGAAAVGREHHGSSATATATLHSSSSSAAPPVSSARRRASGAGVQRGRTGLRMVGGGKAAAADEALVAERKAEQEALRVKNDQEWQFFDTARINVKAGMGGNG